MLEKCIFQSDASDSSCASKLLDDAHPEPKAPSLVSDKVALIGTDLTYNSFHNHSSVQNVGLRSTLISGGAAALSGGIAKVGIGSEMAFKPALLKGTAAGAINGLVDYGISKALSGGDENSWYALKPTNRAPASTIFQPNALELVLTSAAVAVPMDNRLRAGVIGAGWLLARAENYLQFKAIEGR